MRLVGIACFTILLIGTFMLYNKHWNAYEKWKVRLIHSFIVACKHELPTQHRTAHQALELKIYFGRLLCCVFLASMALYTHLSALLTLFLHVDIAFGHN